MARGYLQAIDTTPPPRAPRRLRLRVRGPRPRLQLRRIRQRLAAWARASGAGTELVDDIALATYEALANVVDHAYPDGKVEAWLDARRDRRGIVVTIGDHGRWRQPPSDPGIRGRGLAMMRALTQRMTVERSPSGTTVTLCWSVGQALPHDSAAAPRAGRRSLPGAAT